MVQGQGRRDRVTRRQRAIERSFAESYPCAKPLQPDTGLGQHFRIDIDSVHATDAFMLEDRFGQRTGAHTEVENQRRGDIGYLIGSADQHLFISRNEFANRLVVRVDLKTKVASDGMVHS